VNDVSSCGRDGNGNENEKPEDEDDEDGDICDEGVCAADGDWEGVCLWMKWLCRDDIEDALDEWPDRDDIDADVGVDDDVDLPAAAFAIL